LRSLARSIREEICSSEDSMPEMGPQNRISPQFGGGEGRIGSLT
jgi:hypothetical protein